jgi:protein ImuA
MQHPAPSSAALLRPAARKATAAIALHPSLWLGHQLGRASERGLPTGFAPLDAELPGGGWPRRALSELLFAQIGMGEVRLLAPSLVATQQAGRVVMFFDPPAALSALALAQLGLDVPQLLLIQTREVVAATVVDPVAAQPAALPTSRPTSPPMSSPTGAKPDKNGANQKSLWALEQVLKSGHVGAVVAWLPAGLRPEYLRRLQLAAQHHDGPAFMLRPWWGADVQQHMQPSAAPLRLGLKPVAAWQVSHAAQLASAHQPGVERPQTCRFAPGPPRGMRKLGSGPAFSHEQLSIQLFKRTGPPRLQPLLLNLPSVLPNDGRSIPETAQDLPLLRPAAFVNLA